MIAAVAVLFGLVLLRWALVLAGALALIPRVRACPACFQQTVPIRRPWLRRLLPTLQWRWCPSCGWRGPASRKGSELVPPPADGRSARGRGGGSRIRRRGGWGDPDEADG